MFGGLAATSLGKVREVVLGEDDIEHVLKESELEEEVEDGVAAADHRRDDDCTAETRARGANVGGLRRGANHRETSLQLLKGNELVHHSGAESFPTGDDGGPSDGQVAAGEELVKGNASGVGVEGAAGEAGVNHGATLGVGGAMVAGDADGDLLGVEGERLRHEGGGHQGADGDLEAMGRFDAVLAESVHLPDMAEEVFGAGGGSRVVEELHGEASHGESLEELAERFGVLVAESLGIAEPVTEFGLDELPDVGCHGMLTEVVGDEPVCAGGYLGGEVGIAGGGELVGGGADDARVGEDGHGRGAGHRLLEAVDGHGGAVGGEAVDGGGRGDAEVAAVAGVFGGELADVVDGAAADRDGDLACDAFPEVLGVAVVGMEARFGGEDDGFVLGDAGLAEEVGDALSGGAPGVLVGDDDGGAVGPEATEGRGDLLEHIRAEDAQTCLQALGDVDFALHGCRCLRTA